jgi:hypothetical protein
MAQDSASSPDSQPEAVLDLAASIPGEVDECEAAVPAAPPRPSICSAESLDEKPDGFVTDVPEATKGASSGTETGLISNYSGGDSVIRGKRHMMMEGKRQAFHLPKNVQWQWEHRSGFKCYRHPEMTKIEYAYRRGDAKVRLKSGKKATPMEIFFVDMVQYDPQTKNKRNVQRVGPQGALFKLRRMVNEVWYSWYTGKPHRESVEDYERRIDIINGQEVDEEAQEHEKYHDGVTARIATSTYFVVMAVLAIVANALWMCYDLDHNEEDTWLEAELQFAVAEHLFAGIFTVEIAVRFSAFRYKRDCLHDFWFRFDALLVILMLFDTYLLPFLAIGLSTRAGGLLRIARLVRLTRLTRLIREVPEVMTLAKGIVAAFRSVFYTLVLLLLILYVFGIIFKSQVQKGTYIYDTYFSTVVKSMWTLALHGTLLDAVSDVVYDLLEPETGGGYLITLAFFVFVLVSSLTVMNMLIGIVCEVISGVKNEEEEQIDNLYLEQNILDILECYDVNDDRVIGRTEFKLWMQNPEVIDALQFFGTDPKGLLALSDVLFDESEKVVGKNGRITHVPNKGKLTFDQVLSMVMRLKGGHPSKVADVVELRKFLTQEMLQMQQETELKMNELADRLSGGGEAQHKPLVDVSICYAGKTNSQLRAPSLTIERLIQDFTTEDDPQLTAKNDAGREIGPEVTLGQLVDYMADSDRKLHLTLLSIA